MQKITITVTGLTALGTQKRIEGIKRLRAATGLDLKGTKSISDDVRDGVPRTVPVYDTDLDALRDYFYLREHAPTTESITPLAGNAKVVMVVAFVPTARQNEVVGVLNAMGIDTGLVHPS